MNLQLKTKTQLYNNRRIYVCKQMVLGTNTMRESTCTYSSFNTFDGTTTVLLYQSVIVLLQQIH